LNILLLDDDHSVTELLKHYKSMEQDWNFFHIESLKDTTYTYYDIDIVIVDYLKDKYKKILDTIVTINSEIQTIIISDVLESSCTNGCEYCDNNYKRKRLLKPIDPMQLYDLIKNFHFNRCEYYKSFENITEIIPNILKRFLYLEYDKTSNLVVSKQQNQTNRYTYEVVSFINILEKNNVQYSMLDEYTIKLY